MRRRSNLLVLLGLVTFVVGVLLVYLITNDDDDTGGGGGGSSSETVEVVVATEDLEAGALGSDLIADGRVELRRVNRADALPDAVLTLSQLANSAITLNVSEGEQLRTAGLRSLGGARSEVPAGYEAVTVPLDFVAAGATTIRSGDLVNVFVLVRGIEPTDVFRPDTQEVFPPYPVPRAELLLTNVRVLNITQATTNLQISGNANQNQPAPTAARDGEEQFVVELAVTTADAEKLIFTAGASGYQLYLSRTAEGNAPAGPTPGRDFISILEEEANTAFERNP